MSVQDWLLITLGITLVSLLVLSIIFVYYLIKVMVKLKQISTKADQAASNIQTASLLFKRSVAPRTISRLLGSLLDGLRRDVDTSKIVRHAKYDFDVAEEQLKQLHRELTKFIHTSQKQIAKQKTAVRTELTMTFGDSKILIAEVRTLLSDLHDGIVHSPAVDETLKSGERLRKRIKKLVTK